MELRNAGASSQPTTVAEDATPSLPPYEAGLIERNRLLSGLVLAGGTGLAIGLPFALKAGAEFFLPLTAALVIAITLVPFLEWMERRGLPSPVAALIAVLSFLVACNMALVLIVVPASDWISQLPDRIGQIRTNLAPVIDVYAQLQHFVEQLVQIIAEGPVAAAQSVAIETPRSLLQYVATAAPVAIVHLLFGILVIYFFLSGWTRLRRETIHRRDSFDGAMAIARVIQNVVDATSRYVLTIAIINIGLGLCVAIALSIVGLPSPLMWGGMVALLNFVPYFGPVVAAVLLAMGGLMTFSDIGMALLPAAIQIGFHLVEANVLTPVVLSGRLRMNPLLILISLSFWAWVWGTPGALLAVPLLIIIRTIFGAVGTPDIAGFLFEAGTLSGTPREPLQDNDRGVPFDG